MIHAKKEKKLSDTLWDIEPLSEQLMTTDKAPLENLRCLSAGRANKLKHKLMELR